jgi:small-conductance mechanosensitive channel
MVAGVLVLGRLGVPLSGLTAPAAALGVALGLGGQRTVQDLFSGFFLVAERQYGFGNVIRLSVASSIPPVTGTVEDVTLRITRLRTANGEVVITPNGQIVQVTNLSREWARAVVDVPLPSGADLIAVSECLGRVGAAAFADPAVRQLLLDVPTVLGVESLQVDQVSLRMVARTLPGKQFEVGRELRVRVAAALRDEGYVPLVAVETARPTALA